MTQKEIVGDSCSIDAIDDVQSGQNDSVRRVVHCSLTVDGSPWPFARDRARAIETYWARKHRENPTFFNGRIHILLSLSVTDDSLQATYARCRFADFLYWRDHGFPDRSVRDGFGSAIIRSAEGHILLGRQAAGNANSGLSYFPGGFIDERDVTSEGTIDIDASVAREVFEETGLDERLLQRQAGYLISFAGPLLSIGIEFRSQLDGTTLRQKILTHAARQDRRELEDVVIIERAEDLLRHRVPQYTAQAVRHLLSIECY